MDTNKIDLYKVGCAIKNKFDEMNISDIELILIENNKLEEAESITNELDYNILHIVLNKYQHFLHLKV